LYYGVHTPNFGDYGDPAILAELAHEAEDSGWDGVFIWDHILFWSDCPPLTDPWVALTAIALRTNHIRIGPLVTPLPRRRPWTLARQTTGVDRLSGGRLILGVGIGDPVEYEFEWFGEPTDAKVRAAMLDEGLDILAGLWSGEPFAYQGAHYQLHEMTFAPPPIQRPRIPIWVAGWWPNKPPLRRAARWDGVFPGKWGEPLTPDDIRAIGAYIADHRTDTAPFDMVVPGSTDGDDPAADAAVVASYIEAGGTWWIEGLSGWRGSFAEMRARLRKGPPRVR
jgi:alkanesulfonate monooxygenase SsuD/methylene tetrahydromethanopterin reductase-like flavin-dependent oxidoreductase (luciferase family)